MARPARCRPRRPGSRFVSSSTASTPAQQLTLARYAIGVDVYTGTSQPETFPIQTSCATSSGPACTETACWKSAPAANGTTPSRGASSPTAWCGGPAPTRSATTTALTATSAIAAAISTSRPRSSTRRACCPTPRRRCATPCTGFWTCGRCRRCCAPGLKARPRETAWRPSVIADTLEKVMPSLRFPRRARGLHTRPSRPRFPRRANTPRARRRRGAVWRQGSVRKRAGGVGGGRDPVDRRQRVGAPIDHPRHRLGCAGAGHRSRSGGQDPLRLARAR